MNESINGRMNRSITQFNSTKEKRAEGNSKPNWKYYVGPVPTWYTADHLYLCNSNLTLTFDIVSKQLAHRLLMPWETFGLILISSTLFCFRVRSPYDTDRRTDRRTDGKKP